MEAASLFGKGCTKDQIAGRQKRLPPYVSTILVSLVHRDLGVNVLKLRALVPTSQTQGPVLLEAESMFNHPSHWRTLQLAIHAEGTC